MSIDVAAYDALLARCQTLAPVAPAIDPTVCPVCHVPDGCGLITAAGFASDGYLESDHECAACLHVWHGRYACIEILY